jgi:hypothetical protein
VALTQLQGSWQQLEHLAPVLSWLPDSTSALPQYAAWEQKWQKHVSSTFQDVYALLTSNSLSQQFRCLPFSAVRAWAASDDLRVDSENSVAVVISWWYGGQEGCNTSKQQLEELSGLLRVRELSPGKTLASAVCCLPPTYPHQLHFLTYPFAVVDVNAVYRLTELSQLPWFQCKTEDLRWLQAAAAAGVCNGYPGLPPGWLAKARQPSASGSRVTINWDIPQAQLHAALAKEGMTDLHSKPMYFAGTGMRLWLQVAPQEADNTQRNLGLFLQPCPYSCEKAEVASAHEFVPVKYAISHKADGRARVLTAAEAVIRGSWGAVSALAASSPLDLQPLLSDGVLKLSATLEPTQ